MEMVLGERVPDTGCSLDDAVRPMGTLTRQVGACFALPEGRDLG